MLCHILSCCRTVTYFQDDHSLPIIATLDYGYPLDRIIDVLLVSTVPLERVCTVQPLGVSQNAVFVVDIDIVDFRDVKSDDLGLWKGTGTKKTYFRTLSSGSIRYADCKPDANKLTEYLLLIRRYYVHRSYPKYHRMISDVQSKSNFTWRGPLWVWASFTEIIFQKVCAYVFLLVCTMSLQEYSFLHLHSSIRLWLEGDEAFPN